MSDEETKPEIREEDTNRKFAPIPVGAVISVEDQAGLRRRYDDHNLFIDDLQERTDELRKDLQVLRRQAQASQESVWKFLDETHPGLFDLEGGSYSIVEVDDPVDAARGKVLSVKYHGPALRSVLDRLRAARNERPEGTSAATEHMAVALAKAIGSVAEGGQDACAIEIDLDTGEIDELPQKDAEKFADAVRECKSGEEPACCGGCCSGDGRGDING